MFFSRTNLEKVLRGKKTQTRRLSGRYQVGHTYGIRTWIYEKSLGRIKITAKRQERLGDITEADIRREGYNNLEEFKEAWINFYAKKMGWHPELIIWVYDFELLEAPAGKELPKPKRGPNPRCRHHRMPDGKLVNGGLTTRQVQRIVKEAAIIAGVRNAEFISPHCLRHTMAIHWIQRGTYCRKCGTKLVVFKTRWGPLTACPQCKKPIITPLAQLPDLEGMQK